MARSSNVMPRSFLVRTVRRQLSQLIVEELRDRQYTDQLDSCWRSDESTTTDAADDVDSTQHQLTFTQLTDGQRDNNILRTKLICYVVLLQLKQNFDCVIY